MSHPVIENRTPFAVEPLVVSNENASPLLVLVAKGTFVINGDRLTLAEKQLPVNLAGEYWGKPDTSSYKYEPECAFIKPTTDVVLIGSAYAATTSTKTIDVTFSVGDLSKTVRVFGDRQWVKRFGIATMTNPLPFERIPLIYDRAFGGWDTAEPSPESINFEHRNPVGVGFKRKNFEEGMPLPNLEDPRKPLRHYGDCPPPAGFGFTSPSWYPRNQYAGTYDEAWQKQRSPLLPLDFDTRFFNAATPGLVAANYLGGDEKVSVLNASFTGMLSFDLPGLPPPGARVRVQGRPDAAIETKLDTVIVDADENQLVLIWRANLVLPNGPHDVLEIEMSLPSNHPNLPTEA